MKTNTPHTTVEGDAMEEMRTKLIDVYYKDFTNYSDIDAKFEDVYTFLHHQLQKAREASYFKGYNAGLADGTDKPLLAIEQIQEKERKRLWERVKEIVENVTPFEYGRLRKIFDHSELDQGHINQR